MAKLLGKEYLKSKLNKKKRWAKIRYEYYEVENLKRDPSPVIPKKLAAQYEARLGWCTKAVDALANRLSFDGFENDALNIWQIFKMNNRDILVDSAIRSALISACCFIYISEDKNGFPRLQVIDGKNATGVIDPITNMLTEGYAVLDVDDRNNILLDAYFTAESTIYTDYAEGTVVEIPNPTGYPLLVPVLYRPDANRPFGQSRISKDCMDIQDKARFTITRMEVLAEFNAFPQKYVLGTAEDSDLDTLRASYTTMLEITKDSDGDKPTVGQFSQAQMTPLTEQLKNYAMVFAGLTGLTINDLGFVSDNPSSAEAIKASHGDLERIAAKAQETFGSGFLNAGLVAASLRDKQEYTRDAIADIVPMWKPIFVMDNSALSSFGDGILKINQSIDEPISKKTIQRMTGLPLEE